MNNQQKARESIIRIMRSSGVTLAEISKEIPCHRVTLDKFMKYDNALTPIMFMMIEQWVNDNVKDKNNGI